jgi:hypothetical protein
MIIYKTINLVNGKVYIGKACGRNATGRSYLGSGKYYKRAEKKYGKENFRRTTIDVCESLKDQNIKEIFWIDFYDARNPEKGYNISPGGNGGDAKGEKSRNFGRRRSEETKLKQRLAKIGKLHSEETKAKMSSVHSGKHHSEETKYRMRKPKSEETKEKLSAVKKELFKNKENHPNYRKHHSAETRQKISESLKARSMQS